MNLVSGRVASVIAGLLLFAGSTGAQAEDLSALGNISAAVKSLDSGPAGMVDQAVVTTSVPTIEAPAASIAALPSSTGGPTSSVLSAPVKPTVLAKVSTSIEREAAWLYKAGWPLYALVDKYSAGAPLDEQGNCLATAVYFEARGESLEGQLAVARVVMNRAASGRYPSDWCSVVKQPWQFSFVHNGQFPAVNEGSAAWARAQGVARLAMANVVPSVDSDVLWYHATYVAPSWGRRLAVVQKIGLHLFYRS
jgi:N-acetylmuramoyl-L-alanine amidase